MLGNLTRKVEVVFGSILVLFGLNGFFAFLPIPEKQGFAFDFMHTLHQAKYIMPLVASVMTTTGVLLILNRWVAFALLLMLPVSINIFAFHLFHDWQGLIAAWVVFAMNNFLIIRRFNQYKILFTNKAGS